MVKIVYTGWQWGAMPQVWFIRDGVRFSVLERCSVLAQPDAIGWCRRPYATFYLPSSYRKQMEWASHLFCQIYLIWVRTIGLSNGERGGEIRLIVGFQPLMVIWPTASWIRWCMQVYACALMWTCLVWAERSTSDSFWGCQTNEVDDKYLHVHA